MIRWECAFNIPDSTVQLAVAYVHVDSFKTIGANTLINVRITDERGEITVKEYEQMIAGSYQDVDSIYEVIKPEFEPSEMV